jgi:hypothetical protein
MKPRTLHRTLGWGVFAVLVSIMIFLAKSSDDWTEEAKTVRENQPVYREPPKPEEPSLESEYVEMFTNHYHAEEGDADEIR